MAAPPAPRSWKIEVLPGTIAGVSGPHHAKVHIDEVELMDPNIYKEAFNDKEGQAEVKDLQT